MVSILHKLSSLVHEISIMPTKQVICVLIKLMSEKEQLSFKEAVVRQTIYYVSKQLPPEENEELIQIGCV
jgi:hypothetical protein